MGISSNLLEGPSVAVQYTLGEIAIVLDSLLFLGIAQRGLLDGFCVVGKQLGQSLRLRIVFVSVEGKHIEAFRGVLRRERGKL